MDAKREREEAARANKLKDELSQLTPEERTLKEHEEKWRREYEREQEEQAKRSNDMARHKEELERR